ncbi:hypothetical protein ARMGADRAFT_1013451 [Armillaria gallica]|uniref:Uncharacterized protein n=1 Tax=Armillaria gallica TaxID=47427 RepID=A0A2H3DAG3_ARMGA|nr:hypothetical protein ARMGADRAFT_1013451 [Armillaria gallica]
MYSSAPTMPMDSYPSPTDAGSSSTVSSQYSFSLDVVIPLTGQKLSRGRQKIQRFLLVERIYRRWARCEYTRRLPLNGMA